MGPRLARGARDGRLDTWAELRQIQCPTLVVRGAESPVLPADLDSRLALAVFDVCGAPALTSRVVGGYLRPDGGGLQYVHSLTQSSTAIYWAEYGNIWRWAK